MVYRSYRYTTTLDIPYHTVLIKNVGIQVLPNKRYKRYQIPKTKFQIYGFTEYRAFFWYIRYTVLPVFWYTVFPVLQYTMLPVSWYTMLPVLWYTMLPVSRYIVIPNRMVQNLSIPLEPLKRRFSICIPGRVLDVVVMLFFKCFTYTDISSL